ncbi:Hsp70 family protein [Aquimarina sediminis]|uniref:Hsp70 family protein n=1 Tax=Aquimarina sediminis TaxID=2070536 RepID=UPI000CA06C40|nr:Hsp70 family protein [Aquimarina sediminis]
MLYHTKKPTVHYLFPKGYIFPMGDFEIYSTQGEKKLVEKSAITSFKISDIEAMALLTGELKGKVNLLMDGIKNIASDVSSTENTSEKKEKSKNETTFEKITQGIEFFKLTTKTMSLFWKINTSNNEAELLKYKQEMIDMKNVFEEKGYELPEDFEEIPFQLKEKYKEEGKLNNFQEAAAEFKKAFSNIKP